MVTPNTLNSPKQGLPTNSVKKVVARKPKVLTPEKVEKVEKVEQVEKVSEKVSETVNGSVEESGVESEVEESNVRSRLELLLRGFEEDKRRATENIANVRYTMKLYVTELKSAGGKKRVKRVRDPNKPAAKNGIAKPQVISEDLQNFLHKHFEIPKGSLVSRTGALSKENGLSKYITDKGLRKDGEIHPDSDLIKLLGKASDSSKDGKSKVFYHKSLMKLIGRHFPESKASQAARMQV